MYFTFCSKQKLVKTFCSKLNSSSISNINIFIARYHKNIFISKLPAADSPLESGDLGGDHMFKDRCIERY